MKILILGGTVFLGRFLAEAASERGHEITLFHRGIHGSDLFPQIERLYGDRRQDLSVLQNRQWDAVIDTNGYVPSLVRKSASLFSSTVGCYVFISSVSAYADHSVIGIDEDTPVSTISQEQLNEAENLAVPTRGIAAQQYGPAYGALKALCEQAAEEVMPGRVLSVRPGLIVGPYDYSDRFAYWVARVARGGEVLAPGRNDYQPQFIDVRDLSEWIIRQVETGRTGVYNATGPAHTVTMQQILNECKAVSGSDAIFTWVDEAFLLDQQVQPWSQMPLWLPDDPETSGFNAVSSAKAQAAGLTFRSLEDTVYATLAWERTRNADEERRAGLASEDETRILQLWHQRHEVK